METNSHPEAAASNVKQGQYSPRKRKDTTPRVNPQLAVELVYQELKRVEVYTKRIEDATARKVQIDGKSLESAENRLKNVLADFERLSLTWNAPMEAFTDKDQFFHGVGVDGVYLPFHKANQFLGMEALPTFIANDVIKMPDVPRYIAEYRKHLAEIFG